MNKLSKPQLVLGEAQIEIVIASRNRIQRGQRHHRSVWSEAPTSLEGGDICVFYWLKIIS
jgi:hypothetical protein